MDIHEIERQLNKTEKMLQELLDAAKPLEDSIKEIDKEVHETDAEYIKRMEEIRRERQEFFDKKQREKREFQKEAWEIQANASKIELELKRLREQHAQTMKELAAQQRLEELYSRMEDFFNESPWAAHVKLFQKEDILATVMAYEEGKRGILNANVMGAGKTFEAGATYDILSYLFYQEHDRKPLTLWLTRKSLVKSTAQELVQWNPSRKFIPIQGALDMRNNLLDIAIMSSSPCISNYELLNTTPKARELEWDFVFYDEVHKLKGGEDVQVFHNTRDVTRRSRFFVGLSGSPIQNKPEDIWPIFNILDESRFPSVRRFQREFTRERWDERQMRFVTGVDEARLLSVMQGQVIKQDPKIIQAAWPDKRRIFRTVEMGEAQRNVYDRCKRGIIEFFENEASERPDAQITITAVIAQLTYLRQINVFPGAVTVQDPTGVSWNVDCDESSKLDEAMDLIEELTGEGEQVVVWSAQFNAPLFELRRRIESEFPELTIGMMTGKTPDAEREANESKFQQGEINLLLCNRSAFSEGFNFQKNPDRWPGGASRAVFLDAWWNPKANEQAEDRIWRTGQSEHVDIYYIHTENSVDDFIAAKLDEKEAMIKGIMDSEKLRPHDVVGLLEDLL